MVVEEAVEEEEGKVLAVVLDAQVVLVVLARCPCLAPMDQHSSLPGCSREACPS